MKTEHKTYELYNRPIFYFEQVRNVVPFSKGIEFSGSIRNNAHKKIFRRTERKQ